MMDFSDALRKMKGGQKVRRVPLWDDRRQGGGAWAKICPVAVDVIVADMIMVWVPSEAQFIPFAGSQWDLLAEDWELVPDD